MRRNLCSLFWLLLLPFSSLWAQENAAINLTSPQPATLPKVVMLTTKGTMNARTRLIEQIAAEENLPLQILFAAQNEEEKAKAELIAATQNADLLIVDGSRAMDSTLLRQIVTDSQVRTPRIERTTEEGTFIGLEPAIGERLATYFHAGRSSNFRTFAQAILLWKAGGDLNTLPPAILPPKTGIYHPQYPQDGGLASAEDIERYLAWADQRIKANPALGFKPVIGIDAYYNHIAAEATQLLDFYIREIELRGAIPVIFFHEFKDDNAPARIFLREGKSQADVLISTRLMYHNPQLKQEYLALNVPVLQSITLWNGSEQEWRDSPVGLDMNFVPMYLVMPEQIGIQDPIVTNSIVDGSPLPIKEQVAAVLNKAMRLAKLRHLENKDKRIALMFYNYPSGEKNLSASYLNVPASLAILLKQMQEVGFDVMPQDELILIEKLQALLAPFYRDGKLEDLLQQDQAVFLPVSAYQAYLRSLPKTVVERVENRWGKPENSAMFTTYQGESGFVIPRVQLGKLTLLPQPSRGERSDNQNKAIYHDTKTPPSHFYLASYYWVRTQSADALVHFGTHGTQEWMPGKERGLSVYDDPLLVLGDVPIIYPYIVDNIGEAIQAKRRGRAVIISHLTPPFRPAGLHTTLQSAHDLIHQYQSLDQGAVQDQVKQQIIADVKSNETLFADLGWTDEVLQQDFPAALQQLHDHLHTLAEQSQPLGLHTFSQAPEPDHRLSTVLQGLGIDFIRAHYEGNAEDADEFYTATDITQSAPWQWLVRHVQNGELLPTDAPASDAEFLTAAQQIYQGLSATGEFAGLLRGLSAQFVDTGYGGDPIRMPDSLPTGRNTYGFDPSRIPTPAAWEAGKIAFQQLYDAHIQDTGVPPEKLAFSLWSVEAMRHFGILEAQVFYALGVEPVWGVGGRVTGVKVIPRAELGRPRVDVVASTTGLYRDQFPHVMKLIAEAVVLVAEEDKEPDNLIALNSFRIQKELREKGVDEETARDMAFTRVFTSESSVYGTGLDNAVQATDSWEKEDKLAALYLDRMQYGYGPDAKRWGTKHAEINLFAEHLKGTDGAVLARSSNLYGMLTTDDPFQYLGGLSLAVRNLTGKSPKLYISNLRDPKKGKTESAAKFLARELQTRQFHPGWISALQDEGYAGSLELVESMNNFWGWNVMDRSVVRDDQWQRFHEVYIQDDLQLGLKEWFEQHNPHAKAQLVERMLEASRKGYWAASNQTLQELVEAWQELTAQHDILPNSAELKPYVAGLAQGFGISGGVAPLETADPVPASQETAAETPENQPPVEASAAEAQQVSGQKLEQRPPMPMAEKPQVWWIFLLVFLVFAAGFTQQIRRGRDKTASKG